MMYSSLLVIAASLAVVVHTQAASAPTSFTSRRSNPLLGSSQELTPSSSFHRSPAFTRRGGDGEASVTATATTTDESGSKATVITEATVQAPSSTPTKKIIIPLSTKNAIIAGCTLAFNAGYVNGACLSGMLSSDNTKQAAAAVTGAWTNSALGMASGNTHQFAFNAKCIGSYCTGSLLASMLNPNPTPFEIDVEKVSPAFLIGSLLLYASSSVAKKSEGANKSFIYLAAIACGIQNSVTSVLTSNMVRSAHFSGITSDIGTFLGQVLRGNNTNALKLKVFCGLAVSFWMGGFVSFGVTEAFASTSLLFSSALFLLVAVGLLVV